MKLKITMNSEDFVALQGFESLTDEELTERFEHALEAEFPKDKFKVKLHPLRAVKYPEPHDEYGLVVADLIRMIANCFSIDPDAVIDWINEELNHPTIPIEGGRVQ